MGSEINRIIVVGGGLTGLTAAHQLQNQGFEVTVLDKGYGIGGRLASRALKSDEGKVLGFFDYGMQYFIAQDTAFQEWVNELLSSGVLTTWQVSSLGKNETSIESELTKYRGVQSNRAIAQHLAKDLNVINQTRIERLQWQASQWMLSATDGRQFHADAVVMTPPVPQTLEIFAASDLAIEQKIRSRLQQVSYAPCLSLMVILDRPSKLPPPGGIKVKESLLDWIASNHIKGVSPEGYAITLLAGSAFSQTHWDSDTAWIVEQMMEAAQPWLSAGTQAIATRLHRWKYRHPKTVVGQRALMIKTPGPLVLAGDAFCGCAVEQQSLHLEQAFLSGRYASQILQPTFRRS